MPLLRPFLLTLALVAAAARAQPVFIPATFTFTMSSTHMAASGAGGTSSAPGNETAIFGDDSILLVFPDGTQPYTAHECSDFGTWAAYFGDEDADGFYAGSIVGEIDALWVPPGAPSPANLFDVFLSFQVDTGSAGTIFGGPVDDADVVRLKPRGGFVPFIVREQVAVAMGLTSPTAIAALDVDAFTVHDATGDVYWSLTATSTVNGVSLQDGGVIRLPASAYVANPDGTVGPVTFGGAQIALHETDVDAFFAAAGRAPVAELTGLEIDPAAGTFVAASTGLLLPHLLFTSEAAANGPAIVTTRGGGQVLEINGIVFDNGPALGLAATDFAGGPVGTLSALAVRNSFLIDTPRMLDTFPLGITTPAILRIDAGGATPNDFVLLVAKMGQGSAPGGYTSRHDIFEPTNPIHLVLTGPGRFYEFYPYDFGDGLVIVTLLDGPLSTDGLGHASRTYSVPALPPGIAFAFQYLDLANLALSTPVIPVTL